MDNKFQKIFTIHFPERIEIYRREKKFQEELGLV